MTDLARQPTKREIVEAELRHLWDERNRLLPSDVVEVARSEDHPLHDYFDWDDDSAAARFREVQAAMLIRSVKLRVTTVDEAGTVNDYSVRGWIAASHTGDERSVPKGYLPTGTVTDDPKMKEALLRQMARDAQAFRRRYQHVAEYSTVVESLLKDAI